MGLEPIGTKAARWSRDWRTRFRAAAILISLALAAPAAVAETAIESQGLSADIAKFQEQIEAATAAEQARAESRRRVSGLLAEADAKALAGDFAGAGALLDQAEQAVLPDDPTTGHRVMLARAALTIRQGDLAGANALLDSVAGSQGVTETQRTRIVALKARIAAATTAAEREAAVAEIATLADQAAIDMARQEAARDPGNFGVRLLLGDLLRKAGQFDEAIATADALLADPAAAVDAGVGQRALVLIGRIAVDRGDFAAARGLVERLRATPETPPKAGRIAALEQHIADRERRAAEQALAAQRRAAVDEIAALAGQAAIDRAEAIVAADQGNLAARLLLGDLLRKAMRFDEAADIAEALLVAAGGPNDIGERQRSFVLVARIAADRGDFAAAKNFLAQLSATPETPQKADRVADLETRIHQQREKAAAVALAAKRRAVVESLRAMQPAASQ